jgi:2-C-methyl-D-erythritol 4-phosphate cytidylyltransferase/2-C-methyl-D-erythritol 4-phosphate cytidylyltransferase/2-C-methyl-D-erythritol 2,4-cyclodiphosphate synthase
MRRSPEPFPRPSAESGDSAKSGDSDVDAGSATDAELEALKKEYRILPPSLGGRKDGSGKPLTVLGAAAAAFTSDARITSIVITVPAGPENGEYAARKALPQDTGGGGPRIFFVPGGRTRRESVHLALSLLAAPGRAASGGAASAGTSRPPGYVLIHDGSRPWISASLVRAVMDAALLYGAVIPALPLTETPKELEPSGESCGEGFGNGGCRHPPAAGFIRRHLRRSSVLTAQTPQCFPFPKILAAHEKAAEKERGGFEYTDDAEIWGEFCGPVAVIAGDPVNRKITFPEDLETRALTR